ncbi:MAG: helix-turn-helix domain-containing protein [Labilithrix sp.]
MSNATDNPEQEVVQTHERPEIMTADEVAKLLRVNRKTVYAAFRQGEIPGGRRIGGTIRFSRERVLRWIADGQGHVSRSPRGAR